MKSNAPRIKDLKCAYCGEQAMSMFNGKPYCNKHWLRLYYNGTLELKQRQRTNTYDFSNEDYVVIITKKNERILVDKEDFYKVKNWSWCVGKQGYPVANINHSVKKINWVLFPTIKHKVQDHINGNKLDNRKSNIRYCTQNENSKNCGISKNNSTGVSGVILIKNVHSSKYLARIMVDRKEIYLGRYDTLEEATKVRYEAEKKYFGEYRREN